MNDLIALGYGWHELEGTYRWTKDSFNVYILDQHADSVFLTIRCNKVFSDYNIQYSIDDWKTTGKVNLSDGTNTINIPLGKTKEIKFKCSSFVPENLGASNDTRILGVQIVRFTLKSGNNIREFPMEEVKLKSDLFIDSDYEINKSTGNLTLTTGWHELEENKQRWTTGNGEILINSPKFRTVNLRIYSRKNQILRIVLDDFIEKTEKLFSGFNDITIEVDGVKKINLISDVFSPRDIEPNSRDARNLGVMLTAVSVTDNMDTKDILIKNIFFNHDISQLQSFVGKYEFKSSNIKFIGGFGDIMVDNLTNVKDGKLNLNNQLVFFSHRSGWSFVINTLLKHHNENGVQFEGFLEKPFVWGRKSLVEQGKLPFKCPWIGVLHNPWEFPIDNNEHVTSEDLVKSTIFKKSLDTCKGLYVLSKDLMKHVKKEVDVPVEFLYHPTEFVSEKKMFSVKKFKENDDKKILEVGSWLRKVNSLFLLDADKKMWSKVKVVPSLLNFEKMMAQIKTEREKYDLNVTKAMQESVKNISPLSDDDYDDFLTENIVFVDLYASSANNAIIECMARGTPILINPLPAIVEYLGKDYPFYFKTVGEATEKVNDLKLIEVTHQYLLECPTRKFITKEYFLQEFEKSSIFKSI